MQRDLWWESPSGEWFWYSQDGNWYRASDHPHGVPADARAHSRVVQDEVKPQETFPEPSSSVEPIHLNPWERARAGQDLSSQLRKTEPSQVASPELAREAQIEKKATRHLPSRAFRFRPVVIASIICAGFIGLVFVLPTVAMVTRSPQPFLTPGEALAKSMKIETYPSPAMASWVQANASYIGAIYDDRQVLQNAAIEVAYTQGQKGQATLLDGCLKLEQDVRLVSGSKIVAPAQIRGSLNSMDLYFTKTSNDCLAGLTGQSELYLSQAATDAGPATNAMNQVISKIQASGRTRKS